ncbi:hypothetical protein ACQP2F_18080 [Actinoplanes sp. CA-030573]|uniref:hypothetical protein n=1 Tax=Actinoplanes sp. CA-030573 TaxID=3239898 RepID=UPI003D90A57A
MVAGNVPQRLRAVWLVGATGFGMVAIGASRVFTSAGEATVTAVLVIGGLLLVTPLVVGRIERLSVSPTGFEMTLAKEAGDLGAAKTAEILERTELAGYAESYAFVYSELRNSEFEAARIHLQDALLARATATAYGHKFDASEVRALFRNGSPVMRVVVLGLMEGDPSLPDAATILSAISESQSGNEQFHGLKLARQNWYRMSAAEQTAVRAAIIDDPYIPEDPDRRRLAKEVLELPVGGAHHDGR